MRGLRIPGVVRYSRLDVFGSGKLNPIHVMGRKGRATWVASSLASSWAWVISFRPETRFQSCLVMPNPKDDALVHVVGHMLLPFHIFFHCFTPFSAYFGQHQRCGCRPKRCRWHGWHLAGVISISSCFRSTLSTPPPPPLRVTGRTLALFFCCKSFFIYTSKFEVLLWGLGRVGMAARF